MISWQAMTLDAILRFTMKRHGKRPIDLKRLRQTMGNPSRLALAIPADYTVRSFRADEGLQFDLVEAAGMPASAAKVVVLYLHGGGYIFGSPRHTARHSSPWPELSPRRCTDWTIGWLPSTRSRRPSRTQPGIPMAARAAPGSELVLAGDSAGAAWRSPRPWNSRLRPEAGGRDRRPSRPTRILAVTGASVEANARSCAMFTPRGLREAAACISPGARPARSARLAAVCAILSGLPPMLLFVSRHEVLRDDTLRLAERATAAGVKVQLDGARSTAACMARIRRHTAGSARGVYNGGNVCSGNRRPLCGIISPRNGDLGVSTNHFDVLIVGGGLSGIGAACSLQTHCPRKTYAILEARDSIGGTWDLFRYPGIRSDSDMFTLGYSFRPWVEGKAIADGHSILKYIKDTAADYGIDQNIRFNHAVKRASWSSKDALWSVEAEQGAEKQTVRFTCNFLFICSGYYSYAEGYTPDFPASERFGGSLVHPQKWPEDLDLCRQAGGRHWQRRDSSHVGARPGQDAAHVTMLQRSPTYVVARPQAARHGQTSCAVTCRQIAYNLVRWRNILFGIYSYRLCRRSPERIKKWIAKGKFSRPWAAATMSASISRRATTRGINACAWCPMAICSRRSSRARPRWSPMKSRPSRNRDSNCERR